jgi:pimeloyl-ACP methyl ester carboxylesterase
MSSPTSLDLVQRLPRITDWDKAYSNQGAIPNAAELLGGMIADAQAFRRSFAGTVESDLPYGTHARETIDIYRPPGPAQGTLIFIHGGYWRSRTKDEHCHFAGGALARGWRVALPEYPLCPEVRIGDIARGMTAAVEKIATQVPDGPIVLSGHSAGGHLAAHVASDASGLSDAVRRRIGRIVSLSGLHDLRPLLAATELNRDLRLDAAQAAAASPVFHRPGHAFDLVCVCGADELPEFRRQNALLGAVWNGLGIATEVLEEPGSNHFTVLASLRDADGALTRLLT